MNNTLKILLLLIFPILNPLQAQIHFEVIPGNSTQMSTAIFQDFGPLIDISPAQLSTHLSSLVNSNTYCSACPSPFLEFQQPTPNDLLLTWAAIPNATYYEIAYINLENGSSGTYSVQNTHWQWNNLPDAAYAFSITGHGSDNDVAFSTAADIIIMDTPILVDEDELVYNCDCELDIASTLDINSSTITWIPEVDQRYKFQLAFMDGTNCEIILLTMDSGEPDYPLDFSVDCVEFLKHSDGSNTFHREGGTSIFSIHLEYDEQYYFEFDAGDNPLISATLIQCQPPTPPSKKYRRPNQADLPQLEAIQLYPNPTQDEIKIAHSADQLLSGSVHIYNALGKLMYSDAINSKEFMINISQWPVGRYELQFILPQQIITRSFIKME